MKKLILLLGFSLFLLTAYSQLFTKTINTNINAIGGTDTTFIWPMIDNVSWSVDVNIDTTNIVSGTSGTIDILQSNDEEDRKYGRSINMNSLSLYQLPATIDSLTPTLCIKDDNWSGLIIGIKISKGTMSGDIPIELIFTYNKLEIKQ